MLKNDNQDKLNIEINLKYTELEKKQNELLLKQENNISTTNHSPERQEKEIKILIDLNKTTNEKLKDYEAKFIEINTTKDEEINKIKTDNE